MTQDEGRLGRPPKRPEARHSERANVPLTPEEAAKLARLAQQRGLSKAALLRQLLADAAEEEGP